MNSIESYNQHRREHIFRSAEELYQIYSKVQFKLDSYLGQAHTETLRQVVAAELGNVFMQLVQLGLLRNLPLHYNLVSYERSDYYRLAAGPSIKELFEALPPHLQSIQEIINSNRFITGMLHIQIYDIIRSEENLALGLTDPDNQIRQFAQEWLQFLNE